MTHFKWIFKFIHSRINWILWLIALHLIVLGIAYIDVDISVNSILYIIVLNLGLSVVFLMFTYIKEIRFYLHLENNIEPEALKHKALADTPFQKEVVDYLYQKITDPKMVVTEQKNKFVQLKFRSLILYMILKHR